MIADMLRELAEAYFHPQTGDAEVLIDEFNSSPEFVRGRRRGHADAYAVLHGMADHLSEEIGANG